MPELDPNDRWVLWICSRVGVSLLANVGMDELVTFSRKEYEDLAGVFACVPRCARTD